MRKGKLIKVLAVITLCMSWPTLAADEDINPRPTAAEMTLDFALRPVYLGATLLGGTIFLVSSPFSLLGGNVKEAAQVLFLEPASYTFLRCLGCKEPVRKWNIVDVEELEAQQ